MDGLGAESFSRRAKGDSSILSGFSRASIPIGGRGRIRATPEIVNRVDRRGGNKLARISKTMIPGESESGTCCDCDERAVRMEKCHPGSIARPTGEIRSSGGREGWGWRSRVVRPSAPVPARPRRPNRSPDSRRPGRKFASVSMIPFTEKLGLAGGACLRGSGGTRKLPNLDVAGLIVLPTPGGGLPRTGRGAPSVGPRRPKNPGGSDLRSDFD